MHEAMPLPLGLWCEDLRWKDLRRGVDGRYTQAKCKNTKCES